MKGLTYRLGQNGLQAGHFLPQVTDELDAHVLVHYRPVHDVLGTLGKAQGAQSFLERPGRWGNG